MQLTSQQYLSFFICSIRLWTIFGILCYFFSGYCALNTIKWKCGIWNIFVTFLIHFKDFYLWLNYFLIDIIVQNKTGINDTGITSNFKSIFLVRIAHLDFRHPNEHSTWFLTDLSILLNMTSSSLLQLSNSFMQNGARG